MAPQVRFAGTVSVRLTVPVNPLTADTVIVEVAEVPAWTAEGEVADIVKSVTVNVAATVELHETVAVPELVTLVGVIAPQVRFAGTVSVRLTVPVNPLTAETVIVEVAEVPVWTAAGEVAAIVKSVTVKVAVAEWDNVPLVPVTVRV